MKYMSKERIKSVILLIMLLASIIEVGILWAYQSHGLPISFLSGLFKNPSNSNTTVGVEYFKPYRIILSGGIESHWIINSRDNAYNTLWQDIKNNYLVDLAKGVKAEAQESITYSEEFWGELVNKKAIIFDFNTPIKSSLLSMFLTDDETSAREVEGIDKMVVLPWEDVNNNQIIYIYDGEKIHKYVLPFDSKKGLSRDEYDKIYEEYSQSDIRQCSNITEIDSGKKVENPIPISRGAFFPKGSRFGDYFNYTCSVPDSLSFKHLDGFSNTSSLENEIIGDGNEMYDSAVSTYDNSRVFKNINNVYRIHSNGLLEYKYISSPGETESLNLYDSFKNAVAFINKRKHLIQGDATPDIYLSGITQEKGYVEFTFDYVINGITINADYELNSEDKQTLRNVITIRANGKRVINVWWITAHFEQSKNTTKYNDSFPDLISNYFTDYKQLLNNKNFFMEDVRMSYVIKNINEKQTLKPTWIIYTKEGGKIYTMPAHEKGKD
jgi:hypothetical protein